VIEIHDYNPDWPVQFASLREALADTLREHIISIKHVGSTSVPGLAAKPILDLSIIILRSNPEAARRYAELNQRIAQQFPDDRAAYTEAKTEFIESVLLQATVQGC